MGSCFACQVEEKCFAPGTAFLAGIAFAFQFNTAAISARLCVDHAESLKRGYVGTNAVVKPADRRSPASSDSRGDSNG